MNKPDFLFGGFKDKAEMDLVARALLEMLGADTQATPGMRDGKDWLFVRWGRVKPTEGGARGFVKGILYGYRKGREIGFNEALECEKAAPMPEKEKDDGVQGKPKD